MYNLGNISINTAENQKSTKKQQNCDKCQQGCGFICFCGCHMEDKI